MKKHLFSILCTGILKYSRKRKKYLVWFFIAVAIVVAAVMLPDIDRDLDYRIFNFFLDQVITKFIISDKITAQKLSDDPQIDLLARTYAEYRVLENLSHMEGNSRYYFFLKHAIDAKYEKFYRLRKKYKPADDFFYTSDEEKFWDQAGFVWVFFGFQRDHQDRILDQIWFGKIIRRINMVYGLRKNEAVCKKPEEYKRETGQNTTQAHCEKGKEIKYQAILFEPIVPPYDEFQGGLARGAFFYENKAYLNLALVRRAATMLYEWYSYATTKKDKSKLTFDDRMAIEAYELLKKQAKQSGKRYEDEFLDMEIRSVIGIHEPEHYFHPTTEYPSYLMQVAFAENLVDQSYAFSAPLGLMMAPFFTKELKQEIIEADFYRRREIAMRMLYSLGY